MPSQRFRNSREYVFAMQGIVTPGTDFIIENSQGAVLYAMREVEPYKGMWALIGMGFSRPKSRKDATNEQVMDYILKREANIGLEDLDGLPVPLSWTIEFFDPYFTEEQSSYVQVRLDDVITTDCSTPEVARVVVSLGAVAKIKDSSINKIKLNPERFSRWEFMKETPDNFGPLYEKHMRLYRKLGPYSNLARLLS